MQLTLGRSGLSDLISAERAEPVTTSNVPLNSSNSIKIPDNLANFPSEIIRKEEKPSISRVVWGPFTIGKYYRKKTNNDFVPVFQEGNLAIPGMQILAFNNRVVPLCLSQ